ncbi:MAG: energy transducer TonB [Ignavibacteriaceae bacterium]
MKIFCLFLFSLFCFFVSGAFAQKDTAKTYFANGTIESVIPFSNNVREGIAKFYFENNNLKEERTYLAGRIESEVKLYYENGKVKEIFSITKGKRDGATTTFDSSGNYLTDSYFAEGKIQQEAASAEENLTEEISRDVTSTSEQTAATETVSLPLQKIEEKPQLISPDEIIDSALYRNPEVFPEPVMGYEKFFEKIVYPKAAKEKKREGTVLIKALINEFGDVDKTEIVKGIGLGCEEAAEISVSFTRFYPGLVRGKPVKVEMIFAIEFKLSKEQ